MRRPFVDADATRAPGIARSTKIVKYRDVSRFVEGNGLTRGRLVYRDIDSLNRVADLLDDDSNEEAKQLVADIVAELRKRISAITLDEQAMRIFRVSADLRRVEQALYFWDGNSERELAALKPASGFMVLRNLYMALAGQGCYRDRQGGAA